MPRTMVAHLAFAPFALAAILLFASPTPEANAKDVEFFRDWMAVCPDDGTPCRASTFILSQGSNEARYTLRVAPRGAAGAPQIVFVASRDPVNPAKPIVFQVDRETSYPLQPGSGYTPAPGEGFQVTNTGVAEKLLPALRKGTKVTVSFTDTAGKRRSTSFSLRGSSKALAFAKRGTSGSRGPAAGAAQTATTTGTGATSDWSRGLADFLPAIEACIDGARVRKPRVLMASKTGAGAVAVRVEARDGARWDCLAATDGTPVELMPPPLGPNAGSTAGEGNPIFTAAGFERPGDACWRHEPAKDGAQRQVGWLSYPRC